MTAGLSVLALESLSGDSSNALRIEVLGLLSFFFNYILYFYFNFIQFIKLFMNLGVIMISCALIADGFLGNMQERVLATYHVSQNELVPLFT